jgi:hypothetical protein
MLNLQCTLSLRLTNKEINRLFSVFAHVGAHSTNLNAFSGSIQDDHSEGSARRTRRLVQTVKIDAAITVALQAINRKQELSIDNVPFSVPTWAGLNPALNHS